jgi:hypothetical protein
MNDPANTQQETREQRKQRRLATFGMLAMDANGHTLFSNGVSTELLAPALNQEQSLRNIHALLELRAMLFKKIEEPMDRTHVVWGCRE